MPRRSFASGVSAEALARAGVEVPRAPGRAAVPNAGKAAEQALYRFLDLLNIPHAPQYPWGRELEPPRRYQSDAAVPAARLLIEIMGGAHIAGKDRLNRDIERSRLAAHAAWVILPYTPEEAVSGAASLDIHQYLANRGFLPSSMVK